MKKERSLIFVSILVILLFATFTPVSLEANNKTVFPSKGNNLDATIIHTVYVHNDAELQALAVDGTGTPVDPWIIRDLVINTTDTLGLRIDDTTEHFEILNCTVTASWGIYLDNIADSTAKIKNNTVIDCSSYGIYLNKANGTWIEENNLIDNSRGIVINYCYLTFILGNYCSNEDVGIFIRDSPYASLTNNVLVGDGIEVDFDNLEDMLTVASSGDTVNGKPFILSKSIENEF